MNQLLVNSNIKKVLSKLLMFLLALLPLLHWYDIGLPIGLGDVLMLSVSIVAAGLGLFRIRSFPITFIIVWIYISLNWYYFNVGSDLKSYLPGGIVFFLFVVNVGIGISLFKIEYLQKYMRYIVLASIFIFFFQFLSLHIAGMHFCFVPKITDCFLYENLTYEQIAARHLSGIKPCAFFLEKSYMAYYLIIYLCLELFNETNRKYLYTRFSIIIIVTLLLLQSGSGLVGMAILVILKFLTYYSGKKTIKYIMPILSIPIFGALMYLYVGTDIGASMLDRQAEIKTEGTSGYYRIMHGYIFYDSLSSIEQVFGISVADINNLTYLSYADEKFPLNGIQAPLIQLGVIGLILWIIFYISLMFRTNLCGKMSICILFVLSTLEVTYLGSYMTILTVIACSFAKQRIFKINQI